MKLSHEHKQEIIKTFQRKDGDTGSPEVQIALCTARIFQISEHLKSHRKDVHGRRGLEGQINMRRKLLAYLKQEDESRYKTLITSLELRR